ncbi:MAG: hypothetical protein IH934_04335 [Nanoarchaeota archaeon]|nr:hypothetical protein [Nanoarchaeota archaeon]
MAELFGFDLGLNIGTIGGGLGIFVVLFLFIWISRFRSERRALYGTHAERRLEREEGFGKVSKIFTGLIKGSKFMIKGAKGIRNRLKKDKATEKGELQSEIDADQVAIDAARTVGSEEEVEEYTEALEGRGVGLVASVKAVMDSIANYLVRVRPSMRREEQDVQVLENLTRRLNNTSNFASIDERIVSYLKQIFASMAQVIKRSVDDEHEKETHHGELVKKLREVAKVAWKVIKGANAALRKLTRAERKERKSFKKELKDISKAFRDKKKELRKIKKSKQADPTVLYQLRREAVLLRQQQGFVARLDKQLQTTYQTMDREAREMRRLLRGVTRTEKRVNKHEKSVNKREKAVEKRYKELNKYAEELEKSFEGLTNPHEMAIEFSGKLNVFYRKYGEIIIGDLEFDGEVRNILLLHITITIQMQAYRRLNKSLEQAENAVKQGLAATTDMIAAIIGGQDQKANLKNLIGEIKKAGGAINYETRVNMFLQQLTRNIENSERRVNGQIGELINEDNRILGEINTANQKNSSNIGSTMATMVNRKVQIDSKYMGEARKFEQQLQSRNKIAATAYRQARGLRARAGRQETIQKPGAPKGGRWIGAPNVRSRLTGWNNTRQQRKPVSSSRK